MDVATVIDTKLRRIGNSMGVIIPREVIEAQGYRQGDTIHVAFPSRAMTDRNMRLKALAGTFKNKAAFVREKEDRY